MERDFNGGRKTKRGACAPLKRPLYLLFKRRLKERIDALTQRAYNALKFRES